MIRAFSLLLLLIVGMASDELAVVALRPSPGSPYQGNSYHVYTNLFAVSGLEHWPEWFLFGPHSGYFGQAGSSEIDTPALRKRVAALLDASRPYRLRPTYDSLTCDDFYLAAEYHFSASSNLVLLKYKIRLANPDVFVAYYRSTGRVYAFGVVRRRYSDLDTTDVVFNRMIGENANDYREEPLTTAKLLILFKYGSQTAPLIVACSRTEILDAFSLLQALGEQEPGIELRTFDDLFLSEVSSDSLRRPFVCRMTPPVIARLDAEWPTDSQVYGETELSHAADSTIVLFTACDADLNNLARWRVVFHGKQIASVGAIAGPYPSPAYQIQERQVGQVFRYLRRGPLLQQDTLEPVK